MPNLVEEGRSDAVITPREILRNILATPEASAMRRDIQEAYQTARWRGQQAGAAERAIGVPSPNHDLIADEAYAEYHSLCDTYAAWVDARCQEAGYPSREWIDRNA